ncbi:hypothetical protein [Pseudobutyrivibrio sp.]
MFNFIKKFFTHDELSTVNPVDDDSKLRKYYKYKDEFEKWLEVYVQAEEFNSMTEEQLNETYETLKHYYRLMRDYAKICRLN